MLIPVRAVALRSVFNTTGKKAAVDDKDTAVDEAGRWAGKVDGSTGNLVSPTEAAHGCAFKNASPGLLIP